MTVGLCIKCSDGMVVASDSLTTFGRGVPVLKYSNKVHVLEHPALAHPVAVEAAGVTTFFDKFRDRAARGGIEKAREQLGRPLDIIDFVDAVCEPIASTLLREYTIERPRFFGSPAFMDYSLSLIVAGATEDRELRAYFVHQDAISERIAMYGTIGSGAAYAELFLRFLLPATDITTAQAEQVAIYAIKGVELMDPNVGGNVNLVTMRIEDDAVTCKSASEGGTEKAKEEMDRVLRSLTESIEGLVASDEVELTTEETIELSGSNGGGTASLVQEGTRGDAE